LVACDYSQIELRIAAFLSGDKTLIEIFKTSGDIHRAVAARVFGVPEEQVDYEMRRRAKVINFGILYGMGVNALRAQLGTDRKEAQEYLNHYFQSFHALAQYLEMTKAYARKNGYTKTLFGRKRYFDGIQSSLPFIRAQAERMAINAPIQGTEADIIKIAMIRIDEMLVKEEMDDVHMLLQVHDELVFEIPEKKVNDVVPKLRTIMESVVSLDDTSGIPIQVDAKTGSNWGEMKEIKD